MPPRATAPQGLTVAQPTFSYRAPRATLTRWPEARDHSGLDFTADLPEPLFATDTTEAAPAGASRESRAHVEAARHTVLRRLAPALKHDMVVNLQAISMMAEMLNARLERGGEAAALQASIAKLNRLAREAVGTCLKVATWIDPGEDEALPLHQGVQDCVALMAAGLNFRGFALVDEVPATDFDVSRAVLRTLLAAALLTLADTAAGAGELRVSAKIEGNHAVVTAAWAGEGQDEQRPPIDPTLPRIDWPDVQALAAAENVELVREATQITMRVPRVVPSSPLRMAPM
jgi:hypothetical protein